MADLHLVRELPKWRGFAELYTLDGDYIAVSTVDLSAALSDMDAADTFVVKTAELVLGEPTSGEETMAFRCDVDGEVVDWTEIEGRRGPGSRDDVIADLRAR